MKQSVRWLLLLFSVLLLCGIQRHISFYPGETVKTGNIKGYPEARQQCRLTMAWPGNVSAADNRVCHQQITIGLEKTENDDKRRQQYIFNSLSCFTFSCAKSLIINSHQSSRRQPYFYSILKENRQFRL